MHFTPVPKQILLLIVPSRRFLCNLFVWLCSSLLRDIFRFMSSLIHSFYVCVVNFSIAIASREEGRAGCVVVSLFRNVYNVCHYLFSHPPGAIGRL